MRPPVCLSVVVVGLFLGSVLSAHAGGIGVSTERCGIGDEVAQTTALDSVAFHLYKVPAFRSLLGNRDYEFLWSDTYAQLEKPLVGDPEEENDLDRFAKMLCEEPSNPFGFPFSDIRMVHDYFWVRGFESFRPESLYNINSAFPGFHVASPDSLGNERTHIDLYVPLGPAEPKGSYYAQYPSRFRSGAEDSLTTSDPNTYRRNSLNIVGPTTGQVGVVGAGSWTRADTSQNQAFNHEFEHALNNDQEASASKVHFIHLLASAAEAIGGMAKDRPRFDVPYTKNLIRSDAYNGNYEAWLSFGAYVAYNFRGIDTGHTGRSDDLIWRWAHRGGDRKLGTLAELLSASQCAECETKTYFQNLSGQDRFRLLVHNWRVAQYVNKPTLAEGQFGFPPQFGFDPIRDIGNWQNVDPAAPDSVVVPHETTVTLGQLTKDLSFAGPAGGAKVHAMSLERFGSDYWVVRSDPALASANRDLVVRIAPQGVCPGVRLMASAIGYSNQPGAGDSLWKHPEWATAAYGPVSSEVGTANGSFELNVPNFGLTHKAVLVVLTTSQATDNDSLNRVLPYRLNLALRNGSPLTPNPVVTFRDGSAVDLPAWRPQSDSIVVVRNVQPGSTFGELRVKAVGQAGSRMLVPGSVPHTQAWPDWSPRGDWVAFTQESTATGCNIRVYNTQTGEVRVLAGTAKHEIYPAFSPNGQQLVYVRIESQSEWQLRRVNLDGTNDVLLLSRAPNIFSPRWSPDGSHIYFVSSFSLRAVSSGGGSDFSKSQLIPSASYFDLPLGNNRILAHDVWESPICGAAGASRDRLLARDTTGAGESEILFLVGQKARHPRWSFDNTRVAFTVDSAGATDIRVGQVSYNRAPQFTNVQDSDIVEGTPTGFTLNATDPDGQAITYAAAYLPAGASLNGSQFSWPNPQGPFGREYYVVFRALDSSGVVDNKVVKYRIIGGGGGGCQPPGCEQDRPFKLSPTDPASRVFALAQNQPNPFATATTIRFDCPVATKVRLEIFDIGGRRVRVLADEVFPPGFHSLAWDRTDATGTRVSPGVYLYRMTAESFRDEKRMILLP